ncbi:MAG: PTS sugar transporter subunit IIA [Clostridium sp.]
MDKRVFDRHHIHFDTEAKTQKEAFRVIAHEAFTAGFVKDENAYYEGMCAREEEATTGFQDGIAIPHSKNETCIKPGIFLVKFKHAIEWNALDGKPVQVALGLTIPEDGGEQHLRILSKLARKMISEEFRTALKTGTDVDALYEVIAAVEL